MRRTTTTKALNALLILGIGFSMGNAAFGQDTCLSPTNGVPQHQRLEKACEEAVRPAVDPSLTSVTRRTSLQAQITSTQDDQGASVEFRIGSDQDDSTTKSSGWHALKISGPINKNKSQNELVTLEGLQKNTKIGYVFSWRSVDPVHAFRSVTATEFHEMLCEALKGDHKLNQDTDCKKLNPDTESIHLEDLTYGSGPYKALLEKLGLANGSFLVGFEATYAAPDSFDFVTTDSLEVQSETHDGFAAALGVGWLPYRQAFYYLGLSYRYEEGYQSGKEQEICQAFGTDLGAFSCAKQIVGAPTESKKQIASVEARRYFRDGALALNPRFSYDFENSVSSVQLPVYFLKDGKGTLNGGLTAGWRSDTDDYTLSLFVGTMKNPFK